MHSLRDENPESRNSYRASYYHEIIKNYPDNPHNKDYMITIPDFVLIMINDFDYKVSTQNHLSEEIVQRNGWGKCETLAVVYSLETNRNSIFPVTLVHLVVITVYGTTSKLGSVSFGTCITVTVPYIFAKQLQHFLLTGEL